MCYKRLEVYLAKSDVATRRNENAIIFLLSKAITETEDSTVKSQKKKHTLKWAEKNKTAPIKTQSIFAIKKFLTRQNHY